MLRCSRWRTKGRLACFRSGFRGSALVGVLLLAGGLTLAVSVGFVRSVRGQTVCVGDCDGTQMVDVRGIIILVNIALGSTQLSACPDGIPSGAVVNVALIIQAVNNALYGCPAASATETPPPVTRTPTPTVPPPPGPQITFFGLYSGDGNQALPQIDTDAQENPVYPTCSQPGHCVGAGFLIVVEAKPGTSGFPPSTQTTNSDPMNPTVRPGFQIEAEHNLGAGSTAICDVAGPQPTRTPGGVPGVSPPNFDSTCQATPPAMCQMIADALSDFGCRFVDASNDPCTFNGSGYAHVTPGSDVTQLCTAAAVSTDWAFHTGDTLLTVQWLDAGGNVSTPRRLVVRVP